MRVKVLLFALFAGLSAAFAQTRTTLLPKGNFAAGEELTYKAKFGFFNVGHGVTKIDEKVYTMNSMPCYRVDASGKTASWISIISSVDDKFGTYIDTATHSSQVAYRNLKEGDYRYDEITTFDHKAGKVEVKSKNKETGVYDKKKTYDITGNPTDLIGGFMLLRRINFNIIHVNDTITIRGFFEDQSYNLRLMYKGKENIHTKVGKVPCHKLVPIMPDNKLFDGENSITVWISDDQNKIPVRMEAKMFVGHAGLELEQFKGLKYQFRILKK